MQTTSCSIQVEYLHLLEFSAVLGILAKVRPAFELGVLSTAVLLQRSHNFSLRGSRASGFCSLQLAAGRGPVPGLFQTRAPACVHGEEDTNRKVDRIAQ
jgi:hypothetical protein